MCLHRAPLVLLLASFAVAACAEESQDHAVLDEDGDAEVADDDATETARSAIVGGDEDRGHAAVVALTIDGEAFCSGALIAPTVVMTAAHCLHEDFVGVLPLAELRVFFGADAAGPGTFIEVSETRLHPDFAGDVPGRQEDDIALVRLAVEAPVMPLHLGPAPTKGDAVTVVGFGRAAADIEGTGVKRSGSSRVGQVTPRLLVMKPEPGGTCLGDSGGPALATIDGVEVIVGLHTRSDCRTGMIEERVDVHLDGFLRDVARSSTAQASGDAHDAVVTAVDEAPEDDGVSPAHDGCSAAGSASSPPTAVLTAAIAALSLLRRRNQGTRRGHRS